MIQLVSTSRKQERNGEVATQSKFGLRILSHVTHVLMLFQSMRFFVRAIDCYDEALKKFPASFDLAYNK
jgi:hypothetical protein